MCLLVVCEPNSTPSRDDLHAGACSNPHGYGFAIHAGDKIISERGMSAKKIIKRFLELRKQYPNGYAMWHARYATHGVKNEQNCHPFIVGGDEQTYLAHNGVLDINIADNDRRSDTRVFAEDTLPAMGGVTVLDDDNVFHILQKWAGGSKIAVLTVDPKAQYPMYLLNENLGTWDDKGVWWSNSSHKRTTSVTTTTYPSIYVKDDDYKYEDELLKYYRSIADGDDPEIEICIFCEAIVDFHENPYYCTMCETCYDCEQGIADCLCYHPDNVWQSKRSFEDMI
jgi:glutamine amidotransferase